MKKPDNLTCKGYNINLPKVKNLDPDFPNYALCLSNLSG